MPQPVPERLKPFFDDLDRLIDAQKGLFSAGDVSVFPPQQNGALLPENRGDVELSGLRAETPGRGWGSAVLSLIVDLADRHGLAVELVATVDGNPDDGDETIDQPSLEAFYSKRGFLDRGSWNVRNMVRPPKPPEPEGEARLGAAFEGTPAWTPDAATPGR